MLNDLISQFQEELEHYMTKFVMQAGKTCYRRKRGGELGFFLNCQLKLLGTINAASEDTNEEHEGHWVIQCSKRDSFTNDGIIKKYAFLFYQEST